MPHPDDLPPLTVDVNATEAARALDSADFEAKGLTPTTGDCESIALAAASLFPVDAVVLALEAPGTEQRAAHAAVRIGDTVLDADGETSRDVLLDYATAALKPDEIAAARDEHLIDVPVQHGHLHGATVEKALVARQAILETLD